MLTFVTSCKNFPKDFYKKAVNQHVYSSYVTKMLKELKGYQVEKWD